MLCVVGIMHHINKRAENNIQASWKDCEAAEPSLAVNSADNGLFFSLIASVIHYTDFILVSFDREEPV